MHWIHSLATKMTNMIIAIIAIRMQYSCDGEGVVGGRERERERTKEGGKRKSWIILSKHR